MILKKYISIPYERVQNVDIKRGVFARVFGYSQINIQTAGFSAMPGAEAMIPAVSVEEAEITRDFLMKKAKKS